MQHCCPPESLHFRKPRNILQILESRMGKKELRKRAKTINETECSHRQHVPSVPDPTSRTEHKWHFANDRTVLSAVDTRTPAKCQAQEASHLGYERGQEMHPARWLPHGDP